jgi:anti-sigma-K factor RskA
MSSAKGMDERDEMLAAEYALGTLPHAERVAFEKRLLDDRELRARVAQWDGHLTPLADAVEPVEPPAAVFDRLEAQLFAPAAPVSGWWNSLGIWRGLAVASLAGLLVLGALYADIARKAEPEQQAAYVAQVAGEDSDVRLVALYDAGSAMLRLNRTDGEPAENRDFELWLIPEGQLPISLGVLPPSATSAVTVPDALRPLFTETAILAISDEPAGGSPTGQATGAVLATGPVTKI